MEHLSEKKFPLNAKEYKLCEEVGEGVSATVYKALCIPLNETVAIKVLDLEKCNNDLDGVRREVNTMTLTDHPNLLRAYCSFTTGHSLWVVMPYMAGGSCLHIMKSAYPDGFEEPVIATLLRGVLKALVYLHAHGHIHRDVKAGNILIDSKGEVKLADFGVSASLFDTGDRQRSRNTFVGTPCWMAPEVMQQLHGYDFKADIWSFGITALELAHGHAPFSKYPPMKVLLMTLQNAPPGLDYERDKRFSKSFKDMVAACLVKDAKKRPTSEKLLKHPFFKHARPNEYIARTILDGLSPLGDRFRTLKAKESEFLVQNKAQYGDKEHLSQQEYIRGISAWNFNLEDLKNQAALIQDFDDVSTAEDPVVSGDPDASYSIVTSPAERMSPERANHSNPLPGQEDENGDLHDLDSSLASFPIKPLLALKGYFDVGGDEVDDADDSSPTWNDTTNIELQLPSQSSSQGVTNQEAIRKEGENMGRSSSLPHHIPEHKLFFSGSLSQDHDPLKKSSVNGDRVYSQPRFQTERNYSAPLFRQRRDTNNLSPVEETADGGFVKRKGRFKVTSAELSPKDPNMHGLVFGGATCPTAPAPAPTAASLIPSLQCILQQNAMQRDEIIRLIKYVEQTSGKNTDYPEEGGNDLSQISPPSNREKELQSHLIHLQQSIGNLYEELRTQKMRNAQLESQLKALVNK